MILFDATTSSALRWLGIESPTSSDLERAAEALGFEMHQLHLDLGHNRRPGLVLDERALHLTLRTLTYDDASDSVESGQVDIIAREGCVVAIHQPAPGTQARPSTARDVRLPAPDQELDPKSSTVLVDVLDAVVGGHDSVIQELVIDVEEIEASIFGPGRTSDAERIYLLRREVAEARRAVQPLIEPLAVLAQRAVDGGDDSALVALRVLTSRVHRLHERVESLDHMLTAVFDAHVAQISMQQNEDMRRISAGAALIVVPTLIAGIYGMNFEHMPELTWIYGYPLVLAAMGLTVLGMWLAFRRSGWL